MESIRFACPSELSALEHRIPVLYDRWIARWCSVDYCKTELKGSIENRQAEDKQWLSCEIGSGYAYVSLSERKIRALAESVLGASSSCEVDTPDWHSLYLYCIEIFKELLNDISDELSGVISPVSSVEALPTPAIKSFDLGNYKYENEILLLLISTSTLPRPSCNGEKIESRRSSVMKKEANVEVYMPKISVTLRDIASIVKGSVIITDAVVGDCFDVYLSGNKLFSGALCKSSGHFAVKIEE